MSHPPAPPVTAAASSASARVATPPTTESGVDPRSAAGRRASGDWHGPALAGAYLALLAALVWLMPAPPPEFPGFARDTATAEAPRRLALYADALGRDPLAWSEGAYVWAVRGAFGGLFVVHGLAVLWLAWRGGGRPPAWWAWHGLPVVASAVALAYPPTSADLFYYAASGHLAAEHGVNPYQVAPAAFPDDPLLPYNFWTGITSPYGPLWTTLSRAVVGIVGADPLRVSLAFKLVAALAALGVAVTAARLAERVRPGTGPAAFVLVGWHPILIVESAGTGHHDTVVVLPALLGLLLLARGRPRAAAGLVGLSALVKPVTLPLLALVVVERLRLRPWRRMVTAVGGDGLAVGALAAIVSAPYWAGGELVRSILAEPGRLVSNPFYGLPAEAIGDRWGADARARFGDAARVVCQAATVGIVALVVGRAARDAWRRVACPVLVAQLRAWTAVTVALALVPANAHAWYAVWSLAPIAALTGGRGRWVVPYLTALAVFALAYHTDVSGR